MTACPVTLPGTIAEIQRLILAEAADRLAAGWTPQEAGEHLGHDWAELVAPLLDREA